MVTPALVASSTKSRIFTSFRSLFSLFFFLDRVGCRLFVTFFFGNYDRSIISRCPCRVGRLRLRETLCRLPRSVTIERPLIFDEIALLIR